MSEITEKELVKCFLKDIETYPFKTHVRQEVECKAGRVDITLPDYNIAIEAKSDGSVKKAIGQALTYSVVLDYYGYVLLPISKIHNWVVESCKRGNVGIITTRPNSPNFKMVLDIGGFESFHPSEYTNVTTSDMDCGPGWTEKVVGGFDKDN